MELLFFLPFFGFGVIGFGLLGLVLQIIAIIDILRSNFKNDSDKIIWILVVVFLHLIGAILYFAIGGNQKIRYHG